MKYRIDAKSQNKLSILGFGCMRFPRDTGKTEKLVMSAIERGVNYFDTAYVYPGSEKALGEVLRRNSGAREKIYIATKLPFGGCKAYEDFDRIFAEQLKRLNTDYIDYYLMHNVTSMSDWERIRNLGVEKWIGEKKAIGQIRQIGFSFHGMQGEFLALLDVYDWDFCMIQYNYMNENYQAGRKGLLRAHEKGLPVIIMEPLLGGKLATGLPKKAAGMLKGQTPAAWALRWLWNHKEVTVLLSGMNREEQLDENIKTASTAEPGMLTERETAMVAQVVSIFKDADKIPCTECNYCLPCPKGVNIPGCFAAYNARHTSGMITGYTQYFTGTRAQDIKNNYTGRNCTKCGLCEKQCPQNIEIIKSLEMVTKKMEPLWLRAGIKLFGMFSK